MAVDKHIVLNVTTGQTVISKDNPVPQRVVMKYGDTDHIKFQLVRAADSGRGVTVIDATGLSCQLGLSSAPGQAALTSATAASAADNTHKWTLDLPLNIAGVGSLATAEGTLVWIEALIGGVQRYDFQVLLRKQILTAAVQDPAPDDVGLGRNEAKLTYLPINAETAIARIEVDEVTGNRYRVVWRNGEYQGELIT